MKQKLFALASVTLFGAAGLVQNASAALTSVEMVGSVMVADRLGYEPNVVFSASFGNASIYDTYPAYTIGAYSRRSPRDIWAYRQRGYGWDKVAVWAGVPTTTYQELYRARQFDSDYIWADDFYNRYQIPQADLLAMRRMGYSWRQIAQAAIVSADTQEPISVILVRARSSRGAYYPSNYAYRATPIYVPPRFSNVVVLPARPSYARWWNRPSNGISLFYSSSGGFGLSLNFSSYRRPVYGYWSPRPIVRGYPYRPIVIARAPRTYRPPVYRAIARTGSANTKLVLATRQREAAQRWNTARERTVKEREVVVRQERERNLARRNGGSPTTKIANRTDDRRKAMTAAEKRTAAAKRNKELVKKGKATTAKDRPISSTPTPNAKVAAKKREVAQMQAAQKRKQAAHLAEVKSKQTAQKRAQEKKIADNRAKASKAKIEKEKANRAQRLKKDSTPPKRANAATKAKERTREKANTNNRKESPNKRDRRGNN